MGENGIDYSNLVLAAKKGQKRQIFCFKPLKCQEGLEIQGKSINMEKFRIENPLHKGNFHLFCMLDKINSVQNKMALFASTSL